MITSLKMRCYSTDSDGMMTQLFLTLTLLQFIVAVTFITGKEIDTQTNPCFHFQHAIADTFPVLFQFAL